MIDKLSGLYKRDYFLAQLQTEVSRCVRYKRPLTVLMLEIQYDYFEYDIDLKWVMGYSLYKQLGPLIKETYRNVDLSGRYSGEVFAVSLPETPLEGAAIAGERLRTCIEEHEFMGSGDKERVRIALNIGVATFPDHGKTIEALLETAEQAMERARAAGGNRVVVGPEDPGYDVEPEKEEAPSDDDGSDGDETEAADDEAGDEAPDDDAEAATSDD